MQSFAELFGANMITTVPPFQHIDRGSNESNLAPHCETEIRRTHNRFAFGLPTAMADIPYSPLQPIARSWDEKVILYKRTVYSKTLSVKEKI